MIPDDSLQSIVANIKKNFRKNYPTSLHYSNAFYREVIYNNLNDATDRLTEATVAIQDKGYGTDGSNITAEIIALRKSDDYTETKTKLWIALILKMFPETENNFYTLIKANPLRRYRIENKGEESDFFGNNLLDMALNRGELTLVGSLKDKNGDLCLKMAFEQKGFFTHKGEFIVNADTYAIVDWEHAVYTSRGMMKKQQYKYTMTDGKYLPFFYREVGFDFSGNTATHTKVNTIIFNEHSTKRKNIDRIKKRNVVSNKGDFYKNSGQYDAEYWEHQNILQEEPLSKSEVESLSRFKNLEKQFEQNAK